MAIVTEPGHTGEFLIAPNDESGSFSFDTITYDQNQTIVPGQVIAKVTTGTLSGAFAALGTNTGNPTCGTISVAAGTPLGEYDVVMEDATHFVVLAPPADDATAGQEIGHGVFGSAFSAGGIGFTITAGGTACVAADSFKVTASSAAPADAGLWAAWDSTHTDGTQVVAGIAYEAVTTGSGVNTKSTAVTRNAEVNGNLISYPSGEGAAATAGLLALGIIVR